MNILFTFLYAVFYNCHHPVGFLKCDEFLDYWKNHNPARKKSSQWRLLVILVFKLFRYKTQTNSCYQFYAGQNANDRCVLFHVKRECNHDMCSVVTEIHGLCGR